MLMESGMGCCCQNNRDILKALNKAQADRIKQLEDELIARKEQQQVDLAVKKDLDEKLDKAAADYKALWVERDNLMDTISRMEKTIRDLDERNGILRERLAQTMVDTANGSCSSYAQQGMQSKIAKQATEIKRLTEENEKLRDHNTKMSNMIDKLGDDASKNEILYHDLWLEKNSLKKSLEIANEDSKDNFERCKVLQKDNADLKESLKIVAKDAEANFNRGRIKGIEEIWYELKDCYDGRPIGENQKIFGCGTVGDILMNLSPTWFINKAEEYHEQEEKQTKDIQLGDEVEIFDQYDHSLSDIGIVIAIDKDNPCFAVIGPKFEGCFDETDIQSGNVKKTGIHFDSIPLDYLA